MTTHLNQAIKGLWGDEPDICDKLDSFLSKKDAYSDPRYHKDKRVAQSLMSMRVDSRGDPLPRALLGDRCMYKSVMDKFSKSKTNRRYATNQSTVSGQDSLRKPVSNSKLDVESKQDSRFERL